MAVETELEVLKNVVNKLDSSLEKISEVSNSIGKLLAVHDERLNSLEKSNDKKDREIDDIHSRISTQTREILEKIESMETKLEYKLTQQGIAGAKQHQEIQIEIQKEIKVLEDRIVSLEKWKWYIMGGAVVVGYLFSTFVEKLL